MTDDDMNGECIMECRAMLAQRLGIHTAFFDDSVKNAIILVETLARGFKYFDNPDVKTSEKDILDAREALKLIKPEQATRDRADNE